MAWRFGNGLWVKQVYLDNLSTHKNKTARQTIIATGAEIWDLPAYSPDLNPIE